MNKTSKILRNKKDDQTHKNNILFMKIPERIANEGGNVRKRIRRPTANNTSITNPPPPNRRRIKVPNYAQCSFISNQCQYINANMASSIVKIIFVVYYVCS